MDTRTYRFDDTQAHAILARLSKDTPIQAYRETMLEAGRYLARKLLTSLPIDQSYSVVVTAEDADYLAKGLLETFSEANIKTSIACFWNDRQTLFDQYIISPVVKQYADNDVLESDQLIVLKSIISGACVVKTNITKMITDMPQVKRIHIVAPVMHEEAQSKLEAEFPDAISCMFNYLTLAIDSIKENNEVIPGIGGNVYQRLGFSDQDDKNRSLPSLVRDRLLAI